jgi:hypothetical protein
VARPDPNPRPVRKLSVIKTLDLDLRRLQNKYTKLRNEMVELERRRLAGGARWISITAELANNSSAQERMSETIRQIERQIVESWESVG